jgi:hypothetical protein
MQDCEEMTAEQLWALEQGFHCDAAQRGKGANSPLFLSGSWRFSFLRSHFLCAPVHFFGIALASAKTQEKCRRLPL